MHVCLAITPFFYFERLHPPLALGYLAAIARTSGHSCDLLDLRMRLEAALDIPTRDRLRSYGMIYFEPGLPAEVLEIVGPYIEQWADEIAATNPKLLGISCFRPTRVLSVALARAVKKRAPDTFVLFGGPDCTLNHGEILQCEAIDGVVLGDGEEAFSGVLEVLDGKRAFSEVPNLLFRSDSGTQRSMITRRADLGSLPLPDFEGLPISQYFQSRPDKPPILPILWQRGCVADCTFCNARTFFPSVKARGPVQIVNEMQSHFDKYGVNVFEFYDLSLNNYPAELTELCRLLLGLPQRLRWFGMFRFSRALTKEFIEMLAAAGCIRVSFGLESGSSKVLKHMRKSNDMNFISNTLRLMHQNGIDTHCTLIVGYPTESEEDFQDTIRFLGSNQDHLTSVNCGTTCSIKPGAPLWEMREELGVQFDERGEWYVGDNTLEVRIDRLARLNAAVDAMSFQRSRRFDAWTDNLARKVGRPSPNPAVPAGEIQAWPATRHLGTAKPIPGKRSLPVIDSRTIEPDDLTGTCS